VVAAAPWGIGRLLHEQALVRALAWVGGEGLVEHLGRLSEVVSAATGPFVAAAEGTLRRHRELLLGLLNVSLCAVAVASCAHRVATGKHTTAQVVVGAITGSLGGGGAWLWSSWGDSDAILTAQAAIDGSVIQFHVDVLLHVVCLFACLFCCVVFVLTFFLNIENVSCFASLASRMFAAMCSYLSTPLTRF